MSTGTGTGTPVVATSAAVVTTAEAKAHLRVYHTEDDAYIDSLILTAQALIQSLTCLEFLNTSHALYLDRFPSGGEMWDFNEWAKARIYDHLKGRVRLPLGPVSAITSVKYYDSANSQQTLNSSNYQINTNIKPAALSLSAIGEWPATYSRDDAVEITYTAGYGATSASVPYQIRQAVLLLVGDWYSQRENTIIVSGSPPSEIPNGIKRLLASVTMRETP